jgi:hypothetical protein
MLAESATQGDLEAVATLRDAAAELASTSAAAAAGFSVRALELLPDDSPLRAEVVVESIMLLWQSGRAMAADQLAFTMLAGTLGTDSASEARIRLGLARFAARYSRRRRYGSARPRWRCPACPTTAVGAPTGARGQPRAGRRARLRGGRPRYRWSHDSTRLRTPCWSPPCRGPSPTSPSTAASGTSRSGGTTTSDDSLRTRMRRPRPPCGRRPCGPPSVARLGRCP